jgi:hypothetical protein
MLHVPSCTLWITNHRTAFDGGAGIWYEESMYSNASPVTVLASILLLVTFGTSGAPLRMREAISTVTVSASPDGRGQAASADTAITAGQFVRTGADSRAEFFTGNGVLRLGSHTTLHVPDLSGEIRLEQGTALFDGLPKQARLTVRLDNEPVVIEGGAGFAMLSREGEGKPAMLHVGSLAGRTTVRRGGKSLVVAPAQVLSLAAGGQTRVGAFNLAKQFESCTLVHGFKSPLPGLKNLEREAARFASLQRRGFAQPQSVPNVSDADGRSEAGNNSAGNSGQIGVIGLSSHASASGQFNAVGAEFGFQSRTAIIARGAGGPPGDNGLGNGQDPLPPGWQNPRNPHFGQPHNDSLIPGTPGNRGDHRH